jgi:hypothetical protein
MARARRRIRIVIAICCAAAALALLVAGTAPLTRFMELPTPDAAPFSLGVMSCRLVVSWESNPSPGAWAGQTNELGFRYDRYSNGTAHLWVPLWLFAIPFMAVAVLVTPRTRRRFPIVRACLLALPAIIVVLLWVRSHTPVADFHILRGWFLDFRDGDVLVQRLQTTTYGRYTSGTILTKAQFPLWPLVVVSFIPPVVYVRRHWRALRNLDKACPMCGYDMRATPDRCPECGAVPSIE